MKRSETIPTFADEARLKQALRRNRAFATGLLGLAALVFLGTSAVAAPGFWIELAARGSGGGAGRRARRLVRGDGALPPSARLADPAHRHHPEEQGPHRRGARPVRRAQFPRARNPRRAKLRRIEPGRTLRPLGWRSPSMRGASPRRSFLTLPPAVRSSRIPSSAASCCAPSTSNCARSTLRR